MRRLAYLFPWLFLSCAIICVQFVEPGTFSSKAHAQFVASGLYNSGTASNAPPPPPGYTGPGDVVGSALAFVSVRGYSTAYSSGSNNALTTVTAASTEHCDFFIATNGNLGVAHNCSGSSNGASAATFCATSCSILTAVDQTGNGNSGTQATSAQQPTVNISTSPFTGYSTSFGLSNGPFQFWSLGSGSVATSTFTWIAWINTSSTAGWGIMGGPNNNQPALRITNGGSGGTLELLNAGVASLCTSTANIITANTWQHIAVSWDNSTGNCAFYLNSVAKGGATGVGSQSFSLTAVEFGYSDGNGAFDGKMAEGMVYGSVLTPTQITNIYNNSISNP